MRPLLENDLSDRASALHMRPRTDENVIAAVAPQRSDPPFRICGNASTPRPPAGSNFREPQMHVPFFIFWYVWITTIVPTICGIRIKRGARNEDHIPEERRWEELDLDDPYAVALMLVEEDQRSAVTGTAPLETDLCWN
jgi:hypothetical protein